MKLGVLGVSGHFEKRVILPLQKSTVIEVYAIASRSREKAESFAKKYEIPHWYSSYEELLKDKSIEMVYIPLPNHMHCEWIKKTADAGKHILCEKPLAMNSSEAKTCIQYAQSKNVSIMEAFMYRFHPQWKHALELIRTGEIGKIQSIHVFFGYNNTDPKNIRNIKENGGGALMDIGCYAVSTARFLLETEPVRVLSLVKRDQNFGTDILSSGILDFGMFVRYLQYRPRFFHVKELKCLGAGDIYP